MNVKQRHYSFKLTILIVLLMTSMFIVLFFMPPAKGINSSQDNIANSAAVVKQTKPLIQVAIVVEQNIPRYFTSLGTVKASQSVNVVSQVNGQLISIHFADGQQVNAGDLLAQIDPRPFEITLAQVQGQLIKNKAIYSNAQKDLLRYKALVENKLTSQQKLDTQISLVQQIKGQIKSDQSAVDNAQLQLNFSRITAPISGRLGLTQINAGNYIHAGNTSIVEINQTQPIDVLFTIPERNISDIVSAQKNGIISLEAWDRDSQNLLTQGQLTSLDNQIDTTTGTIKLKGSFTNYDNILFPNQFVNIKLKVEILKNALVIPTSALQRDNQGHYVWIVDHQNKVSKHRVVITFQDHNKVIIASGVQAGQQVVTDGIDQLTSGTIVEVLALSETSIEVDKTPSAQLKAV